MVNLVGMDTVNACAQPAWPCLPNYEQKARGRMQSAEVNICTVQLLLGRGGIEPFLRMGYRCCVFLLLLSPASSSQTTADLTKTKWNILRLIICSKKCRTLVLRLVPLHFYVKDISKHQSSRYKRRKSASSHQRWALHACKCFHWTNMLIPSWQLPTVYTVFYPTAVRAFCSMWNACHSSKRMHLWLQADMKASEKEKKVMTIYLSLRVTCRW